jgi:hypothetical protein
MDDVYYVCTVKHIYKVYKENPLPEWVEYLDPVPIKELNVVIVFNVDLRRVRRNMRELLVKMYSGFNIIFLNIHRDMIGIINVPSDGILKGIVFYSTKDIGKLSPELAVSIEAAINYNGENI